MISCTVLPRRALWMNEREFNQAITSHESMTRKPTSRITLERPQTNSRRAAEFSSWIVTLVFHIVPHHGERLAYPPKFVARSNVRDALDGHGHPGGSQN